MESRRHVVHRKPESSLHDSPSSSPLRRRSIIAQKPSCNFLLENDDEAERIARRRESYSSTVSTASVNSRRHSLGLSFLANIPASQMAESISHCIKLSAENKINIKNAFSLEMIDFMTYMIKKQDDNMSNLQVASTSLDVSTKIYGFRVDSVHTEILKIVGGLDKQATEGTEENSEEHDVLQENVEMDVNTKKKKKRSKQKIFNTVEALKGNVEIAKPLSMMIGEGDLQTSDMLYQAILPNHANSGFYQHLYNDVLVDMIENNSESQKDLTKYTIPIIEDFSDLEICALYSNFEFIGWTVEDEPEQMSPELVEQDDNNRFQFDLDASIEDDDNPVPEPMNYFDIEHDNEDAHGCYMQVNPAENVVNVHDVPIMHRLSKTNETREYTFVQPNTTLHWAGPSHWKFRNCIKHFGVTKVMGACMQAPLKKRRTIELSYDKNKDITEAKFAPSHSNKLHAKTAKAEWNTENLTLPEDIHYDITQAMKLYLHPHMKIKPIREDDVVAADISDNERYDYNNPNDTSDYCPGVNNDDYNEGKDDNEDNECNFRFEDGVLVSQGFTGDNLVAAPKLANKITIPYCLKAKKIDMRQLKKAMWKCLKSNDNTDMNIKEAVEQREATTMKKSKNFSDVYKMLPKLLSKTNAEALSVPISFVSLLHLANEETLKISSLPDMSDVIVTN